jgi:hypothetical protein
MGLQSLAASIGELLERLFIPSFDIAGEIKAKLNEKFGIFNEAKEAVESLNEAGTSAAPKFEIEIYGSRVMVIDFAALDPFLGTFRQIVILFAYYRFLRGLIKKIPRIIAVAE